MASIHRRPRSPFWHGAWRDQNGRLHLQSTKQTDRAKALAFVMEIERAQRQAESPNAMTELQAKGIINGILERVGGLESVRPIPSVAERLKSWMDTKRSKRSEGTATRYQSVADGFIKFLGKGAARRLDAITTKDIEGFLNHRRASGVSASTVAMDCKILRTMFNKAKQEGLITLNPAAACELETVNRVERGTFTPAEIALLVDTAQGEWKTLILVAYFTGQRLGDCCSLSWAQVDLEQEVVSFKQQKTGTAVDGQPLHPDLLSHLKGLRRSGDHVMPHLSNLGPGGRHGLSEGFKRIMVKAGIDTGTFQGDGTRKLSKRSFHALRHSFTSALANAGVSPELRMRLTGHKSAEMHKGYTHHEMQNLKDAVNKLPRL